MPDKFIRTPVLQTMGRSPFDSMIEHASKLNDCLAALKEAVRLYLEGDYEASRQHGEKVKKLEHEADIIKSNIRGHLPKFIFLPVNRADFLKTLREVDSVLDYAEDVAVLLDMRETAVPEDMKADFLELMNKVILTTSSLEKVLNNFKDLLDTSFAGRERDETKEMIKRVHKAEYESDLVEGRLTKRIFNMQGDPISVMHLLKVVDRLGEIANHAENAADWVRAMISK